MAAIGWNCAAVLTIAHFAIRASEAQSMKDSLRIRSESVELDSRRHQQLAEGAICSVEDVS